MLGQVRHYKASVRKEALTGICELLQSHPDLFAPNFSKILLQVSPTLTDDASPVRRALCALLKHLLMCATLDNVRPFANVIVAHLVCGLTHINEEIQLDSLKVFELLLAQFPTLLVPSAHKLLPLLVQLVSRQKRIAEATATSGGRNSLLSTIQKSLAQGSSTSSGGLLASTPHSRLAELDSRLKIFSQLCSFMEVILNSSSSLPSSEKSRVQVAPIVDIENGRVLVPSEDGSMTETRDALCYFGPGIPHLVVLKHHGILPSKDAFLPSTEGRAQQQDRHLFSNSNFVNSLMSLLVESWVECDPGTVFNEEEGRSKSKNRALPLMETILKTMCLILMLVQQAEHRQTVEFDSVGDESDQSDLCLIERLQQKYWSELDTHLVSHFPFSAKSLVSLNQSSLILSMDFTLCHIMLLLHPTPNHPASSLPRGTPFGANLHVADIICNFFVQLETSGKLTELSSAPNAVLTLVSFLPTLIGLCQANVLPREKQGDILGSIWSIYKACHPLSSSRQSLVKCFSEQLMVAFEQNQEYSRSVG